jgi:hypothetical protein
MAFFPPFIALLCEKDRLRPFQMEGDRVVAIRGDALKVIVPGLVGVTDVTDAAAIGRLRPAGAANGTATVR